MPDHISELIDTVDEWAATRYGDNYDRASLVKNLQMISQPNSRVPLDNKKNLKNFALTIQDTIHSLPRYTPANRKKILQAIIFIVKDNPFKRSPSFPRISEYAAVLSCLSDRDFSILLGNETDGVCPIRAESLAYAISCIMHFQEVKNLYLEVRSSESTFGPHGIKSILHHARENQLEPAAHYPLFSPSRALIQTHKKIKDLLKRMGEIAQQRIIESGSREEKTHALYNRIIEVSGTADSRYLPPPCNAEAITRSLTMDVNLQEHYTTAMNLANGAPGWASEHIQSSADLAVLESIFKCIEDKQLCDFTNEEAVKACAKKMMQLNKHQRLNFYKKDPICARFLLTLESESLKIMSAYRSTQIHRIIQLNDQENLPSFSELNPSQQQLLLELTQPQWTAIATCSNVREMLKKNHFYISLYTISLENQPIANTPICRVQDATALADTLESHALFQDYEDEHLNEHIRWFCSLEQQQQQQITELPEAQIAQLRQAHAWTLCYDIGIEQCLTTLKTIQTFSHYQVEDWQPQYNYLQSIHRLPADERTKLLHLDSKIQKKIIRLSIDKQLQFLKQEPDSIQRLASRLTTRQVSSSTEEDTEESLCTLLSATLLTITTEQPGPHNNHWRKLKTFVDQRSDGASSQPQRARSHSNSRPSRSAWFLLENYSLDTTLHYLDLADDLDKIKCFIQLAKLLNEPTSKVSVGGFFTFSYGGRGAFGIAGADGIKEMLSKLEHHTYPRWFPVDRAAIEHTSSLITTARHALAAIVTKRLMVQPSNSRNHSGSASRDPQVQALYDAITTSWPEQRDNAHTGGADGYDLSSGDDDDEYSESMAALGGGTRPSGTH